MPAFCDVGVVAEVDRAGEVRVRLQVLALADGDVVADREPPEDPAHVRVVGGVEGRVEEAALLHLADVVEVPRSRKQEPGQLSGLDDQSRNHTRSPRPRRRRGAGRGTALFWRAYGRIRLRCARRLNPARSPPSPLPAVIRRGVCGLGSGLSSGFGRVATQYPAEPAQGRGHPPGAGAQEGLALGDARGGLRRPGGFRRSGPRLERRRRRPRALRAPPRAPPRGGRAPPRAPPRAPRRERRARRAPPRGGRAPPRPPGEAPRRWPPPKPRLRRGPSRPRPRGAPVAARRRPSARRRSRGRPGARRAGTGRRHPPRQGRRAPPSPPRPRRAGARRGRRHGGAGRRSGRPRSSARRPRASPASRSRASRRGGRRRRASRRRGRRSAGRPAAWRGSPASASSDVAEPEQQRLLLGHPVAPGERARDRERMAEGQHRQRRGPDVGEHLLARAAGNGRCAGP